MEYDGFISYSHADDGRLAPAVQRGLQRLAKPWNRRRALRVFRDQTGLSTNPHLWSSIAEALDASRWFVLITSPEAVASDWVNREIDQWLATKPADQILPVVAAGEWTWDPSSASLMGDAVPEPLRRAFRDEPRHLDLRWVHDDVDVDLRNPRFRDAIADLAAPMHGVSKDDIEGEDVRQHRRARRLARGGVTSLTLLVVISLVFGLLALQQRGNALDERNRANRQAVRADQQARLADSSRLAVLATSGASADLSRSALLAIEANRLENDTATRGAILAVAQDAAPVSEIIHGSWNAGAVSADGRTVATVGPRGVSLTDLKTRRSHILSRNNDGDVRSVSFSPDGTLLALGGQDVIDVLNTRSGAPVGAPFRFAAAGTADQTFVAHVHFSSDGTRIAAIDNNGSTYVWSVTTHGELAHYGSDTFIDGVPNVMFSPDGKWLSVTDVGFGNVGHVLSAQSFPNRQLVQRYPSVPDQEFGDYDVAFSPDSSRVAAATDRGQILFRNAATGAVVNPTIQNPSGVVANIAFSPDGHTIAGSSTDGAVSVWDAQSGALLEHGLFGATRKPLSLTFTPSGALVVLTAAEIVVLDPSANFARQIAPEASPSIWNNQSFAAAPDGSSIAIGDTLGRVRVWDQTGKLVRTITASTPLGGGVLALAYIPGTPDIAVGAGDGTIAVWNPRSGQRVGTPLRLVPPVPGIGQHVSFSVAGLAFDAHGRTLTAETDNGQVAEIDPKTLTVRRRIRPVHQEIGSLNTVAMSPDGRTVAVAAPGTVGISNPDGSRVRRLDVGAFAATSVAFAPDSRLVAVGIEDGRVLLVNPVTARVQAAIVVNHGEVDSLTFSPDGRTLAIAGSDATVTLWSVADQQPIGPALTSAESTGVLGLAYSPDGKRLFAAANDGSAAVYTLNTADEVERLCAVIGRNLAGGERRAYMTGSDEGRRTCPQWPVDQ